MYNINDLPIPSIRIVAFESTLVIVTIVALILAYRRAYRRPFFGEEVIWIVYGFGFCYAAVTLFSLDPLRFSAVSTCWIFAMIGWPIALIGFVRSYLATAEIRKENPIGRRNDIVGGSFCVVVILFSWVLSLAHPREIGRRTQCKNNLKQIGLSFWNFESNNRAFPGTANAEPPHSWRVAILPFLDQKPLFDQYAFRSAWDSTQNAPIGRTAVDVLHCPSRFDRKVYDPVMDHQGRYFSQYLMLNGPNTVGQGVGPKAVEDGLSNTIFVVEACGQNVVWTDPHDVDTDQRPPGINLPSKSRGTSPGWISSNHSGGANVLLGDGSVRFLSEKIDPKILTALSTIDQNEVVGDF